MNFHFAQPQYAWMALAAAPLLGAFFFWSWRVKQKLVKQFIQPRLLGTLMVGFSPERERFRMVLLGGAVVAGLLALARPQWGFVWEEVQQKGLDILVAIDTSRSMLAQDVPPNRLEKAKLAAFDLMRQAKSDRLGLIAFAGSAFLQSPLTIDDEVFRQNVETLSVGIIPQGGTALSEAIRTAIRAFEKDEDNHRVLVLFTDGEDHDADQETLGAAQEAAKAGIKIFTVGVGTAEGELLRVPDAQGNMSFIKDDDGNVVKSHLNESLLEKIATTADGFYLPLRGANAMDVLYTRGLAPLPKSQSATKLTRTYRERYQWPLGFAVICLVVELLLPERKRSRASQASSKARAGELQTAAAIVCLLLLAPRPAFASPSSAFRDYQSGDFQDAYDEYSRLLEKKTNDYRLQYDAGTAAYRAKQLDAAEKDLKSALNSAEISADLPAQEQAYYNLGNTLYKSGEPLSDPDKKKERWETSVENYVRALRLNTNDLDAKNNLAFVKQKLEELKQQQQQEQQQKQDQKDQKDQKKDQNQQQNKDQKDQNKGQQNQDKSKQQQQQQAKQDQDKQQSKQDQKQQQEQQQKQAQAQKDKDKDKSDQVKAGAEDQRDKSPDQEQQAATAMARMTPQQARQLLQAQRDYEKALQFAPETNQPATPQPGKFKDW